MTQSPEHRRLETRRAYTGRVINVDLDTVQAPDGSTLTLEMVRHPGAAAIVPLLSDPAGADPQVLLIRQYRYAAGGPIWEVPAGVLEPGESPEACARRELMEETGARAERIEYLTTIYTTPGFTDERIHLFLATGITAGEPRPMSDEFLVVEAKPLSRALEMIRDREVVDAKSIVALLFLAGFQMGL
jgi:ADP-ribose pyrophosphatase